MLFQSNMHLFRLTQHNIANISFRFYRPPHTHPVFSSKIERGTKASDFKTHLIAWEKKKLWHQRKMKSFTFETNLMLIIKAWNL